MDPYTVEEQTFAWDSHTKPDQTRKRPEDNWRLWAIICEMYQNVLQMASSRLRLPGFISCCFASHGRYTPK